MLIEPGTERALLAPMPVRTLPGVGPATGDHLRRAGITTVGELAEAGEDELVRLLGKAHGHALYAMALARDERPVVAEREAKSVSVEDTYDVDIHDRVRVGLEVRRLADRCVRRLRQAGLSGQTIVLKVRRYDFSTLTRSETLRGPTDDPAVVGEAAARLRRTRWTPPAAYGCSAWASAAWPTTRRRTCSRRRPGSGRRPTRRRRWRRGPSRAPGDTRRPLGHPGGVVEIDLVDGADPGAVAVERLAADQVARIDVGTHGPSTWSKPSGESSVSTTKEQIPDGGHSNERPLTALVGWHTAADPVRESPPGCIARRRKEQILPGISQAHVPHGRGHSESTAEVDGFRSHRR
ncbi:DNA polymerase IV [Streptomyces fumanus]